MAASRRSWESSVRRNHSAASVDSPSAGPMLMVCPLWNLACGGQLGLWMWVSFQSATSGLIAVNSAVAVKMILPALIVPLPGEVRT
ncbi:hypothetical protein EDD27_7976 [Nonomuraea polychroma]|uniref:Uncharacterized protein n=1 Tax=Nonomuraea polychroma TaxID=46176 RepID=A0A438MHG8_9ACTN|nr:hypothetical protein EDD27_7976 [Nonomuraea polychroma]